MAMILKKEPAPIRIKPAPPFELRRFQRSDMPENNTCAHLVKISRACKNVECLFACCPFTTADYCLFSNAGDAHVS